MYTNIHTHPSKTAKKSTTWTLYKNQLFWEVQNIHTDVLNIQSWTTNPHTTFITTGSKRSWQCHFILIITEIYWYCTVTTENCEYLLILYCYHWKLLIFTDNFTVATDNCCGSWNLLMFLLLVLRNTDIYWEYFVKPKTLSFNYLKTLVSDCNTIYFQVYSVVMRLSLGFIY